MITNEDQIRISNLVKDTKPVVEKIQAKAIAKPRPLTKLFITENVKKATSLKNPSIKILYTNSDQLTAGKLGEIKYKIQLHKPLIVAICEVKPKNKSEIKASEYNILGYTLYPVNLENDTGRGIAVFVKNEINSSICSIESKFREAVLLEIKLKGGDCLSFSCIYRSPTKKENSAMNAAELNSLISSIAKNKKYTHRCIIGDFNYKDIDWVKWNTQKSESSIEEKFLATLRDCFLYQHVDQPTRRRGSDEPSLLDLVLTDELAQISDINYDSPLGKSDHCTLIFDFNCYVERPALTEKFNYLNADYDSMLDELKNSNWVEEMEEFSRSASI